MSGLRKIHGIQVTSKIRGLKILKHIFNIILFMLKNTTIKSF